MYFSFFMPAKIPPKKSGSTRSEFCEILSPTPPAFRKISLAFRICISAHHILFKRLCGVQSVSPYFCFSRSSVLRTEALQRAGNVMILCFENRFGLGTINTPHKIKEIKHLFYLVNKDYFLVQNYFI